MEPDAIRQKFLKRLNIDSLGRKSLPAIVPVGGTSDGGADCGLDESGDMVRWVDYAVERMEEALVETDAGRRVSDHVYALRASGRRRSYAGRS